MYLILLAALSGFMFFNITAGQGPGQPNQINKYLPDHLHDYTSIKLKLNEEEHFHCHHSLVGAIVLFIILSYHFKSNRQQKRKLPPFMIFVIGFCIGTIIQGMTYPDRLEFVKQTI